MGSFRAVLAKIGSKLAGVSAGYFE